MKINNDLTKLLSGNEGKWVALSADCSKVVGEADSPREAIEQAHKNKEHNPILTKSPRTCSLII